MNFVCICGACVCCVVVSFGIQVVFEPVSSEQAQQALHDLEKIIHKTELSKYVLPSKYDLRLLRQGYSALGTEVLPE